MTIAIRNALLAFAGMVVWAPVTAGAMPVETILHSFDPGTDGSTPTYATLIIDANGNLYGANQNGGPNDQGVVYRLSPPATQGQPWVFTTLYAFTGAADGGHPFGRLAIAKNGTLFGVTSAEVWQLVPSGGSYSLSVIYKFGKAPHPSAPVMGLAIDRYDRLYGTTTLGGTADLGTVYRLAPTKKGYTGSVLHSFTGPPDGEKPLSELLVVGTTVYGTTQAGGNASCHCGTEYQIAAPQSDASVYSIIYNVGTNSSDSPTPTYNLTMDPSGNLYGVTYGPSVYQLTPPAGGSSDWTEATIVHATKIDGDFMLSPLWDSIGSLYYPSVQYSPGGVHALKPPKSGATWTETIAHKFNKANDVYDPASGLVQGPKNSLYGVAAQGGAKGKGGIYSLTFH